MLKLKIPVLVYPLLFLTFISNRLSAQDDRRDSLRLMFYNVENLFDTFDDSLKNDNDFLPKGLLRWNLTRYDKKINSIYKTIVATGDWNPPAIISFCEVENRKVLEDLVYNTFLLKFNYRIIHEDSPDPRGIDVCLIFREDHVELISYRYWVPSGIRREGFSSRSVLYSKFRICNDTMHLIVNHWPSRRGGVLAGEDLRNKIAVMIRQKVDSISDSGPSAQKIIIMGDFNCTPDDTEIKLLCSNNSNGSNLLNLSEGLALKGRGTYRFRGTWEMIDQVIVTETFIADNKGLHVNERSVTVFDPDFLLTKDPAYPGLTPFSTYRGFRYQGGYSDHLPVLIDLIIR